MKKSTHGGARKGAGKKPTGVNTVRRQFSIDLYLDEILNQFENRSRVVNTAIRYWYWSAYQGKTELKAPIQPQNQTTPKGTKQVKD